MEGEREGGGEGWEKGGRDGWREGGMEGGGEGWEKGRSEESEVISWSHLEIFHQRYFGSPFSP